MKDKKHSNKSIFKKLLSICLALLVINLSVFFAFNPSITTFAYAGDVSSPDNKNRLTITYNEFLRSNGSFIQILLFNLELEGEQEELINETLKAVSEIYRAQSLTAEINGNTLQIVIGSWRNLTEMHIELGRTGFDPRAPQNVERGVFFNTVIHSRQTPFCPNGNFIDVVNIGKNTILYTFPQIETTFIFNYGTFYRNFSTNADTTITSGDLFVHSFIMSESETSRVVEIRIRNPHTAVWYGAVSLLAVIAGIAIFILAKKQK